MLNLLYVLLYISVFICIYFSIKTIMKKEFYKNVKNRIIGKNTKYSNISVNKFLKKRFSIINSIYILLLKTGIRDTKVLWWITPKTVILLCIVLFILSSMLFLPILKLPILTFLFCIPIACIPIFLLMFLCDLYEENIEKNLISYIIQLKNQAKISNDIIYCFKNTVDYLKSPLSMYIKVFLFQIEQGVNISTAFDELKQKVDLDRFRQLINNMESCYINGGNLYNLLEKTQSVFLKLQNERNKRNEDTLSARIVLIILIIISIFIYFRFINFNQVNFNIMINSLLGQAILVFNFISIWLMLFLVIYVRKFDQ